MTRESIIVFILSLPMAAVLAQPVPAEVRAGDTYEIVRKYETSQQSDDGSSGSSNGHDTVQESVVEVRQDGLVLAYDLPTHASKEDRERQWQLPALVFMPTNGQPQLLDTSELEVRADKWLKKAKLTREACGHWIFTWNAFKIECDPQSALKIVEGFDLRSAQIADGATYRDPQASAAGLLKRSANIGQAYTVEMPLDTNKVRDELASAEVVVGEIMKKPTTLERALLAQAGKEISGTIVVTFDTVGGSIVRRTRIVTSKIKDEAGRVENRTSTEILERRLVSK